MKQEFAHLIPFLSLIACSVLSSTARVNSFHYQNFEKCLIFHSSPSNITQLIHTPNTPSFNYIFQSFIQNLRFTNPMTCQPVMIIAPNEEAHVQAAVVCCKNHGLRIRVRSGGHDYEGLSYSTYGYTDFAIVDLSNLRSVSIDVDRNSAWVQSGAILGELYYHISKKSSQHGFPAGLCPTVGIGGHISGGGFGTISRKHGLAADNVIDAKIVNVNGQILDRKSMGEDLFWAIRGGGQGSFGIVTSWKLSLVPVPNIVSVFTIHKVSSQGAVDLVNKWQYIADKLPEELFIRSVLQKSYVNNEPEAVFSGLFLGNCDGMVNIINGRFPELGFQRGDCKEISWIESVMYFSWHKNGEAFESLLKREGEKHRFFKGKSDFVTEPVPNFVWDKIWLYFLEVEAGIMIMDPHGGKLNKITEFETPYPHREGNMYNIQYLVKWDDGGDDAKRKHVGWINKVYDEMSPYASKNPRGAYVNYRDFDLGVNDVNSKNTSSYTNAKSWGISYYKSNFERLAMIKAKVDPSDYFRNEQSVPPLQRIVTENKSAVMSKGDSKRSPRQQTLLAFLLSNVFSWC